MATGTQNANNGPIDSNDINDWMGRFNQVLAQPSEHLNSKSPDSAQSWHSNFIEFWNPLDTCLVTWCLPCVTFGKTHHRLRKNGNLDGYQPVNTSVSVLIPTSDVNDIISCSSSAYSSAVLPALVFIGSLWLFNAPMSARSTTCRVTASSISLHHAAWAAAL
jgi:hypothetical protein